MDEIKKMDEIIVMSQKELDAVPVEKNCIIKIKFGTPYSRAVVRSRYMYPVVAKGNSSVVARGNSSVVARGNSSVVAWENSSVVARENSSVVAWGNSSVVAWGNSSVVAMGNSSVVAMGNSSVVAWGNSSVVAWGNSSVVAMENSSVVASGNVQVVDYLQGATIQLFGNARTVFNPRNIEEFMNFYGIEHDKTTAIFYKAVHKKVDSHQSCSYVSDYDDYFKYEIGKKVSSNGFNSDVREHCGKGIHISHKSWALDYGINWKDFALLEVRVEIKDILLPECSDGKVRVPSAEVIREVPLEECGVYGKILAKRKDK